MSSSTEPENLPTTPIEPSAPSPATTTAPERTPFLRRTWVRVTGAAVAAVLLLGIGFGTGWAASAASSPWSPASQQARMQQGDDDGMPGRPGMDDRRGGPHDGMRDRDHDRDGDGSSDDDGDGDSGSSDDSSDGSSDGDS